QPNEDVNRTLWLDDGEDTNADGRLTPPLSAAGSVPATVTTDANGVAAFDLIYPKASAVWIEDALTASTLVFGSENRTTYTFWLPYLKEEACFLPDSPYKTKYLILTASRYELPADICSEATLWAHVYTAKDEPVEDGELVAFTLLTDIGGIQDPVVPTVGGVATTTYTGGYLPEEVIEASAIIRADLIGSPCTTDTITLKLVQVERPEASFEIYYLETIAEGPDVGKLKLLFRDTSTTAAGHVITSRTWNFYQGGATDPPSPQNSTLAEPEVTYGEAGTYTVRLDVRDDRGYTDTVIKTFTLADDGKITVSDEEE
ncbi:MAG TPA: PKD domain-containing protein, partial [Syntrophales bacterium]|nr:PKD domain-containing protein [Syntrophales bacterium]